MKFDLRNLSTHHLSRVTHVFWNPHSKRPVLASRSDDVQSIPAPRLSFQPSGPPQKWNSNWDMYHSSKSSATGHLIFIRHGQQNKEKDSERALTDQIYCELNLFFHFCFLDGQQITCQRYQLLQSFPKEHPKALQRCR